MDVTLENTDELVPAGSCPNCALYCGWYALKNYRPCCRFVPGAVAWHLASLEMTTLRNPGKEWAGNLLKDGAAATLGPVAEPYTSASRGRRSSSASSSPANTRWSSVMPGRPCLTSWVMSPWSAIRCTTRTPRRRNCKSSDVHAQPAGSRATLFRNSSGTSNAPGCVSGACIKPLMFIGYRCTRDDSTVR